LTVRMLGPMNPVYPCRILQTRHCPAVYDDTCDAWSLPCARYESTDETPWVPEVVGIDPL